MAGKSDTSNRGFASMDEDKQREIARRGGENVPDEKRSFSKDHELASEAGRERGQSVPDEKRSFSQDRDTRFGGGKEGWQTVKQRPGEQNSAGPYSLQSHCIQPFEGGRGWAFSPRI